MLAAKELRYEDLTGEIEIYYGLSNTFFDCTGSSLPELPVLDGLVVVVEERGRILDIGILIGSIRNV